MLKVKVSYVDENGQSVYNHELRNLRPRRYMCGWSFDRMMKYIKEELYWDDIKEDSVTSITIENEREHWVQGFMKLQKAQ